MMPEVKFAAQYRWVRHLALQHAGRAGWRCVGSPLAAVMLFGLLAGCSSTFDALPQAAGGLPAEAPPRSANPSAFPEVHSMPPDRGPVMTETEQKQAEKDLVALRDKQQRSSAAIAKQDQNDADGTATTVTPPKASAKPTKKNVKPADPSAGTGRNP